MSHRSHMPAAAGQIDCLFATNFCLHVDPCLFTEHCYWLFTVIKRHYYVIIPNFFPIIVAYSI